MPPKQSANKKAREQREQAAKQGEAQAAFQAQTQTNLDQLKAWAAERLLQIAEHLSPTDAAEAAQYLVTRSTGELYQWELDFLGGVHGFAQEFIDRQERLGLAAHRGKRDDAAELRAIREQKERQDQQKREGIYHGADDTASVAGSTTTGATSKRKGKKVQGGLNEIQRMDLLIPDKRIKCECEGRRHKLLQNCLNCGKIICEQEGAGPCHFCGLPPEGLKAMKGITTAKEVKKRIEEERDDAEREHLLEMQKAIAQRDRLLHYEQTKAKRTTVIDDQIDYFESTSNQWLTAAERDQAMQREEAHTEAREARERYSGAYTVELDVLNRIAKKKEEKVGPGEAAARMEQIVGVEETPDYDPDNIFLSPQTAKICVPSVSADKPAEDDLVRGAKAQRGTVIVAHPGIVRPIQFLPEEARGKKKKKQAQQPPPAETENGGEPGKHADPERVQNKYWEEDDEVYRGPIRGAPRPAPAVPWVYVNSPAARLSSKQSEDRGMCLSMHQPWASLLVHGIKRHEGRTWPTEHRGRLWIHAASHQPSPQDVAALENFYRGRGCTRFPTHYPTSVLLGCVDVVDCLHTDEYKVKLPEHEQESESEYVFICTNFQLLVVPLRMEGKHKIFQLEKIIWQAAKTQAGTD